MRTIESPGVEIRELDRSIYQQAPVGTNVLVFGFASQGPTDEMIQITSKTELNEVLGLPSNAAERYLHQTAGEILDSSPARLFVTRLPYGSGDGAGYSNHYGALVYPLAADAAGAPITIGYQVKSSVFQPASAFATIGLLSSSVLSSYYVSANGVTVAALSDLYPFRDDLEAGDTIPLSLYNSVYAAAVSGQITSFAASAFVSWFNALTSASPSGLCLGAPVSLTLNEYEYDQLKCGGFNWATINSLVQDPSEFCPFDADTIGGAGLIVVNESRTTFDDQFAGYYLNVTDNFGNQPTTDFDDVTGVQVAAQTGTCPSWTSVPTSRLQFALSATFNGAPGSLSEIVENIPGHDFGSDAYRDSVIVSLWKLRPTNFTNNSATLDRVLVESFVGSLNSFRKESTSGSTTKQTYFIENVINNNSRHLRAFVNPNIAELSGWFNDDGTPARQVRVLRNATASDAPVVATTNFDYGDNLYSIGEYQPRATDLGTRPGDIGNLPAKLQRAINYFSNPDLFDIDVTVDGGLSTIWTTVKEDRASWYTGDQRDQSYKFNDTAYLDIDSSLAWQPTINGSYAPAGGLQDHWETIYNIFNTFAQYTMVRNGGVGHFHVQDLLRQVFVNGRDCKAITSRSAQVGRTFSRNVYWPLRNLLQSANSSYSATYGNWVKVYDTNTDKYCWAPFSGWAAAAIARTDAARYPWIAPAGLTRGIISNIVDIAINPNQQERDQLYKIGVNPVVLYPDQGYTIWGQKTLLKAPSAFDRINVRRLFLTLEKVTLKALRYFVFEPNTIYTRTRLKNVVSPVFDLARNNEGLYDYLIICDERNNNGASIDNNELNADFYLKPVKAGEFVGATFIATRSGVDFKEII